ncbi:MAG: hydroxymethylglutaryl-CoA lyase [Alphaproteobacteria bacterium]|nr:hydroxymethylglutaryl-CoA lyase [Alphaproteobacteria bacterium]
MTTVEIIDVGPRDGLQSIPSFVPTETKVALIKAIVAAGIKRLEVGSFVSHRHVPQMRDTADVIRALGPMPGVRMMALVPNMRGAEDAIAAGIDEIIWVVSMSESHNRSNVRRSIRESMDDLRRLLEELDRDRRLRVRVALSTAFDCPYEGRVNEADVLGHLDYVLSIRDHLEIVLADTTGMALAPHVRGLAGECLKRYGTRARFAFHCHDTAGLAIANVLASYEAGIRVFEGSVAGLGGCPFAPGATGNVAVEDLVYLFHRMGVATGVDLEKYLEAAAFAAAIPDGVSGGHVRHLPRERVRKQLAASRAA